MTRPGQSLLAALAVSTVVVTAALCWAGWRLLEQQRAIDDQRARERIERSADAIAAEVRGKLAEAGERLSGWVSSPAAAPPAIDGAVVLTVSADGVRVSPPGTLPFVPLVEVGPAPTLRELTTVEAIEFAENRPAAAAERYRALGRSRDPRVRAGALLRLGRVLRKSGDFSGALSSYRDLTVLANTRTDDLPADLAGLDGQRAVLRALGDGEAERRIAADMLQGLDRGRWLLTRGMAEFYRDQLNGPARPDSWRLAGALNEVWSDRVAALPQKGQRVLNVEGSRVLVAWRSAESRSALLTTFPSQFFASSVAAPVRWRLVDPESQTIAGDADTPTRAVARIIGNVEYPWTLHVWAPPSGGPDTPSNRRVLLMMMAAVLAFVWGASYVMGRAIRREAAVARLQSDFVAAVSHEFRSPLTTVRQMAEMLEAGRVRTDERRRQYYGILAGEATRLQRLVETLLNFGRIEAGAERYCFADVDAAALVRNVVRDIEPQAQHAGTAIEMEGPDAEIHVVADEHALAMAVRNLIDNAIKYSPNRSTVSVQLKKERDRAAICVIDRGAGIPRTEQQAIFRKFVRGRAAIDANVKGTGVGLSMVRHIVAAHGGEIRLDSEVGRGSTFTLLLPAAN